MLDSTKKQFGFKVGIFLIYFSRNPLFRLLIGAQTFDSLLNKDFKKKKKKAEKTLE
jgi:hypothetical protein